MISFVEAKLFTRLLQEYLSDDELLEASAGVAFRSISASVLKQIKDEIDG